ncbi:glutamine dumper 2-like protein [Tanacetum coccineum]|uniref:Glutamine dumper 2-like protein n=1 Tax=Tanacetum coccineum TaxID=301880 RepID=A0ABQ5BQ92_9ASTR
MLRLIVFAFLILACSYWQLSSYQDSRPGSDRDLKSIDGDTKPNYINKTPVVFEEKYLIIMVGQANPTFLATPISSRVSSFGRSSYQSNTTMPTNDLSMSEKKVMGKDKGLNTESLFSAGREPLTASRSLCLEHSSILF